MYYAKTKIIRLQFCFIALAFFTMSVSADDFITVRSIERHNEGLLISLQIRSDSQTRNPLKLRIGVENLTDETITASFPHSSGPAVFQIQYKGETKSTRPPIIDHDSLDHDELPARQITYWTYSVEELMAMAGMSESSIESGERYGLFSSIRFFVPSEVDNEPTIVREFLHFRRTR